MSGLGASALAGLGPLAEAVTGRLAWLDSREAGPRLWGRDPSLFKEDPRHQAVIAGRLGWLEVHRWLAERRGELEALASAVRAEGVERVLLLGMGGSSLFPEVLARVFGPAEGAPSLQVLDTTDPSFILDALEGHDLSKTLFVVASKSGGTIETASLLRCAWARHPVGRSYVAITDPGSELAALGTTRGFRAVLENPVDVGGRYSALSYFGMAPAALLGLDLGALLDGAEAMAQACGPEVAAADNPAFLLGAALGEGARAGYDKLTLVADPALAPMGAWIEQLVAESTGKEGRGVVPVDGEELARPEAYSPDRLFIHLALANSPASAAQAIDIEATGAPSLRLEQPSPLALGGECLRWEIATSVASICLGVNPFDEPNVTESKQLTAEGLARFTSGAGLPDLELSPSEGPLRFAWSEALEADSDLGVQRLVNAAEVGDYLALLAYLPPTEAVARALAHLRGVLGEYTGLATTLGFGPRFLHASGQLHKGGPDRGVFLQLTCDDPRDLAIPEAGYSLSVLKRAQALGDFQALAQRGRRVQRCHLASDDPAASLEALAASLAEP